MPPPPVQEDDDEIDIEDEDEEMEEMMDPFDALGSFLSTDDGETIATALVGLKDATEKVASGLEMQNKILIKIMTAISKMSPAPQTA
jgi:hypothetical protein